MRILFFILTLIASARAYSHPVAYQDAWSLMSTNRDGMSDLYLGYSVTSRYSVGAHHMEMDMEGRKDSYSVLGANYLLKRWNEVGSQGNIYLGAGGGLHRDTQNSRGATYASVETDWESQKIYTSAQAMYFHANDEINFKYFKVRGGFAPYVGDYKEINTWIIWQVEQLQDQPWQLTQLLRLYYRNALVEIGYRYGGGYQFNYMVHF